jgi:ribosomal protein S18 acetylase RimI-like enzyme
MEIRRLGPDEVTRFRAIRLRGLRDAPGAFGTTFEGASGWSPDRWSTLFSSLLAFVAVAGDVDVGLVRAAPDLEVRGAARLGSLWVAPEARCQGVGAALVETVVEWARSEGYEELLLDVSDDNDTAVRFYEALGFVPTGRTSAFPAPREHLVKHQRRLRL